MPNKAKIYIAGVLATGALIFGFGLASWHPENLTRLAVFLALFLAAAMMKCKLPGITGTYSPLFFFVLLGSTTLSFAELIFASAVGGIVQSIFRPQSRPSLVQVCFNAANLVISSAAGFAVVQQQMPGLTKQPLLIALILGASVFYFVNTSLVSVVLTLVGKGSFAGMWKHWCLGSLPYYVLGALIVGATISSANPVSTAVAMLVAPSMLLATIYYRFWLRNASFR